MTDNITDEEQRIYVSSATSADVLLDYLCNRMRLGPTNGGLKNSRWSRGWQSTDQSTAAFAAVPSSKCGPTSRLPNSELALLYSSTQVLASTLRAARQLRQCGTGATPAPGRQIWTGVSNQQNTT